MTLDRLQKKLIHIKRTNNRMKKDRLSKILKNCKPQGLRNWGWPLKRLLEARMPEQWPNSFYIWWWWWWWFIYIFCVCVCVCLFLSHF